MREKETKEEINQPVKRENLKQVTLRFKTDLVLPDWLKSIMRTSKILEGSKTSIFLTPDEIRLAKNTKELEVR
jgi:hypothetical protein